MSPERKATDYMFGGSHYTGLGIQPIEFAMANSWDAGAFSILKYLSRHASKNGLQDVQKARHFVELRDQFIEHVVSPEERISIQQYVDTNGFKGTTASGLYHLSQWVRMPASDHHRDALLCRLDELIAEYEGGQETMKFIDDVHVANLP